MSLCNRAVVLVLMTVCCKSENTPAALGFTSISYLYSINYLYFLVGFIFNCVTYLDVVCQHLLPYLGMDFSIPPCIPCLEVYYRYYQLYPTLKYLSISLYVYTPLLIFLFVYTQPFLEVSDQFCHLPSDGENA